MQSLSFLRFELDAILFDLDGTLIDSDDHFVSHLVRSFSLYHRFFKADSEYWARRLVMRLESPAISVLALLDKLDLDNKLFPLKLFSRRGQSAGLPAVADIGEMLHALNERYHLGIVSNRDRASAEDFLQQHCLQNLFQVIITAESTRRLKPHPEPLYYASSLLHTIPSRCLMVGDTSADILAGRRAGAWTVGVLCGFGQRQELALAGAHLILDTTAHLHHCLLNDGNGND